MHRNREWLVVAIATLVMDMADLELSHAGLQKNEIGLILSTFSEDEGQSLVLSLGDLQTSKLSPLWKPYIWFKI